MVKGDILVVLISRPYHFLLKIKLKIKKGNLRSRNNFSDLGGFLKIKMIIFDGRGGLFTFEIELFNTKIPLFDQTTF